MATDWVAEYLSRHGWKPATTDGEEMFETHGVAFRRDEAVSGLLDANYTAAELIRAGT